ncbi:hypothetical protein BDE36_2217 [Arcticibacter tournemirensis]|nr:hypothetical protein BDE36_2217 [Arcticibacter tournemirensis]
MVQYRSMAGDSLYLNRYKKTKAVMEKSITLYTMIRREIWRSSLLISILFSTVGLTLKILHLGGPYGYWLLIAGIIAHVVFVITSLFEINGSYRISSTEKIIWTIGFIFFSVVTAILYCLMRSKR